MSQYYASDMTRSGGRREGWGSVEATEMVLNNLFYITAKVSGTQIMSRRDAQSELEADIFCLDSYKSLTMSQFSLTDRPLIYYELNKYNKVYIHNCSINVI